MTMSYICQPDNSLLSGLAPNLILGWAYFKIYNSA